MELREVVRRRRMVRYYEDEPVPQEALDRILETATRAPSAGFAQGQSFIVVRDPKLREQIAGLAEEPRYLERGFDPWLSSAPVHIVVCVDEAAYRQRYEEMDKPASSPETWPVPYPMIDAGASMMLILLAAVDEGLAAGFLGIHRLPGLPDLLDIPGEVSPIGLVTLGHAAPDRRSSSLARGRKAVAEVVHRERWSDNR